MSGITKAELQSQIRKQVGAHEKKGPTYAFQGLVASEQSFQQAVKKATDGFVAEAASLERATDTKSKARRKLLEQGIPVLQCLIPMHEEASRRLDKAGATYDVSPNSQVVYTPAQKQAATELADEIVRLRTAGSDVTMDGTPDSQVLRDGLRVGSPLNRSNAHAVKGEAAALLLSLKGPDAEVKGSEADGQRAAATALQAGLEARGVLLAGFVPAIEDALVQLVRELDKDIVLKRSEAREARDLVQIEVEQINARILVTVNALGGIRVRDTLREELPKTTQGQRASDRTDVPVGPRPAEPPRPPGPVVAGPAAPAVSNPAVPAVVSEPPASPEAPAVPATRG